MSVCVHVCVCMYEYKKEILKNYGSHLWVFLLEKVNFSFLFFFANFDLWLLTFIYSYCDAYSC